jgi:heptosyltransferase-1
MRILLVKTSSLGDVIHNLPVAADLARQFPGVEIDWCVEEAFADIPKLSPAVRSVIPVAIRRWRKSLLGTGTWGEIKQLRSRLKTEGYDAALDTQGLIKSAVITRQAPGKRLGYNADSAREPLAARFYDSTFTVPRHLHAVERNRLLAGAAFGYTPPAALDYGISAPDFAAPWLPPTPIPGAIAAPPLSIRDLAGLLGKAALAIGVDTGLAHLAAALRVPTIALYTATEPALTGVVGTGFACNLGGKGRPPTVAEVLSATEQGLHP